MSWSQCLSWHSNQSPPNWANPTPSSLFKLKNEIGKRIAPVALYQKHPSHFCQLCHWLESLTNPSDASNMICHCYSLNLTPSHGQVKGLLSNTTPCPGFFAPGQKGTAQCHNGFSKLASADWIIKHNLGKAKKVWDTFLTSKQNDFRKHKSFHNNRKQSFANWASMVKAHTKASAAANALLLTLWLGVPQLQLLIITLSRLKLLSRYGD